MVDEVEYELSALEIFYLSHLLGGASLLDIDPSVSPPTQRAQDGTPDQAQIDASLEAKGHMLRMAEGSRGVDAAIAAVISVISHPWATIGVTTGGQDGNALRSTFYLQGELAVEVRQSTPASYHLTALASSSIARCICRSWLLDPRSAPDGARAVVPEQVLYTARWLARDLKSEFEARTALTAANLAAPTAAALARTFATQQQSGAVLMIKPAPEGGRKVAELALLGGENGYWLLRPLHALEGQVEVLPCTALEIATRIQEFMTGFGPAPGHVIPSMSGAS